MSRRRSLAAASLLLGALLVGICARADELRVVPSVSAKGEYNSNLFFSENPKVDTYIATVTPGFEVTSRTERADAGVSAYAPVRWYTVDTNLDKVDQLYQGRLGYRFTPALRVSGTAGYRDQSNPDRYIEETRTGGDQPQLPVRRLRGGGVYGRREDGGQRVVHLPKVRLPELDGVGQRDPRGNGPGGARPGPAIPGTKGRLVLGVSRSVFDTSRVTNYSAAVGIERAVHELWSVVADVGARYTRSEFDTQQLVPVTPPFFEVVTSRQKEGDFGWTVNVSAVYKGETTGGSLTLYHDVAAAPGRGGAVQRSAAVLEARQRTTWELTPFFSAGYYA